jgi:hypothetical protein
MREPANDTLEISSEDLETKLNVLRFAAYHLEAGAHSLFIYLDGPESNAYA